MNMKTITSVLVVLIALVVLTTACGPSASERATATAMADQLATANAQVLAANLQNTQVAATAQAQATQSAYATMYPPTQAPAAVSSGTYLGKWIDPTGDTYEFFPGGKLHAVASGKDYDTTYTVVDDTTMSIDFGPILGKPGDTYSVLTVKYVLTATTMTITFTQTNQSVTMTRVQ
jgi:hypothetical protein